MRLTSRKSLIAVLAGATLALVGCSAAGDAAGGPAVTLLDYTTHVPTAWQARTPSNPMRIAEYQIPGSGGGQGADVVVYYFGPGQGGTVQANIARWQSQFSDPGGGHVQPTVTQEKGTTFPTTVAEFHGSYARGVGMGMGDTAAVPDQGLLAAIVETPKGNLFFQLFGPDAIVTGQKADFLRFVRGLKGAQAQAQGQAQGGSH